MEKFNTFYEDMPAVWGDNFSVTSEIGTLRTVLVHRPGKEIENIKDPSAIYFRDFIDVEKARWERSFWHVTTIPVGIWVIRIAEEVLLMCWPPAPLDR